MFSVIYLVIGRNWSQFEFWSNCFFNEILTMLATSDRYLAIFIRSVLAFFFNCAWIFSIVYCRSSTEMILVSWTMWRSNASLCINANECLMNVQMMLMRSSSFFMFSEPTKNILRSVHKERSISLEISSLWIDSSVVSKTRIDGIQFDSLIWFAPWRNRYSSEQ